MLKNSLLSKSKPEWADYLFKLLTIPPVAHFIVSVRSTDSLAERFHSKSYYVALLFSLAVGYMAVCYISFFSRKMDKKYAWHMDYLTRALKQFVYAFCLPLFVIVMLSSGYFAFFGVNILDTGYLNRELPIVALLVALASVFYFALYFKFELLHLLNSNSPVPSINVYYKDERSIIEAQQIACVYLKGNLRYIVSRDGKMYNTSKKFVELVKILEGKQFFKINRHALVNKNVIKLFEPGDFGKLNLGLTVDIQVIPLTVSKDRASSFKVWFGYE